jgi:hypothetical protein
MGAGLRTHNKLYFFGGWVCRAKLRTLLLSAEARRVELDDGSIHMPAASSMSSEAMNATESTAGRSKNPFSALVPFAVKAGWQLPAGWAAHNAAVAGGWAAHHAAWAKLLQVGSAVKGAGMLAKPVITPVLTSTPAQRAATAIVLASTRSGLITAAATKAAPWAFLANPIVGGAVIAGNIALTGWQLFRLQRTLKDPVKLCGLLSHIPGTS